MLLQFLSTNPNLKGFKFHKVAGKLLAFMSKLHSVSFCALFFAIFIFIFLAGNDGSYNAPSFLQQQMQQQQGGSGGPPSRPPPPGGPHQPQPGLIL